MTTTTVGVVARTEVKTLFMMSLLRLEHEPDVTQVRVVISGPGVFRARNEITASWLEQDDTDYLLMLDSDMVFEPEHYRALKATFEKYPTAGAASALVATHAMREGFGIASGPWNWDSPGRYDRFTEVPDRVQLDVAAGAGFLLIRREAVAWRDSDWWTHFPGLSEDISFAYRLHENGWDVLLDPSVRVGHIKPMVMSFDENGNLRLT